MELMFMCFTCRHSYPTRARLAKCLMSHGKIQVPNRRKK